MQPSNYAWDSMGALTAVEGDITSANRSDAREILHDEVVQDDAGNGGFVRTERLLTLSSKASNLHDSC